MSPTSCTESSTHLDLGRAPWWLPTGHLQTVYASLAAPGLKPEATPWVRERWSTPDNDWVWVDHSTPTGQAVTATLVLFHGLEGNRDSHYAQAFAQAANARGWRMVLPHFRGCGGGLNDQPRAYHSGDHEELNWMLGGIHQRWPGRLFAVGISLGGNALLRWAQEQGTQQPVQAIASLCAPLDLVASGLGLEQGLNRWLYTPRFLRTMKPKARALHARFPGAFDVARTDRATTLREFDDAFTAPLHGFDGVMDYWTRASAKPHLHRMALPALVVNSLNDPFVPAHSLPTAQTVHPNTVLCQPQTGGHLGFVQGAFPGHLKAWPEQVMNWLDRAGAAHHG
jgi:predicted alpha/beta-fold hydrolase